MSRITSSDGIIDFLKEAGAIRVDEHFVYTSGKHGPHYINLRAAAHYASWLDDLGQDLAEFSDAFGADLVIGPETLGRTLAQSVGTWAGTDGLDVIWC
jgi:orotate phosphoribosyltransferase